VPRNTKDSFQILGVNTTIKILYRINSVAARPAVAKGMAKGLAVIRKGIRRKITTGVEGTNLNNVRATIGTRFVRSKKKNLIWAKVGASVGKPRPDVSSGGTRGKHISKNRNAHWYFVGTPNRAGSQMWTRNQKPQPVREGYRASRGIAVGVMNMTMIKVFTKNMKKRIRRKGWRSLSRDFGRV
jgi:hypothetical protein